jgi:hypothetical protein
MASQSQPNKVVEESPSMISVEILGYGGGESDNEDEEGRSASL